ncbi:phage tail assembly protein [Comamonas sp. CMM03]|uniref:phage tail assembly protein n=1 Tax=Comamonas sp. CMM03 TaxID=2854781 RepID=UPI001C48AEB2|nr:phage tail assembly protein [Comamonas sp. CMM03]MBV7417974.1 phage tail assembly protein [Comamonas sp. CMM03]
MPAKDTTTQDAATQAIDSSQSTAAQDDKIRIVTLEEPITRPSGQRIEVITIRKPMGGPLRRIALSDLLSLNTDALHTVLPRVTEPPLVKPDFDLIDPVDLVKLGTELVSFFVPRKERS